MEELEERRLSGVGKRYENTVKELDDLTEFINNINGTIGSLDSSASARLTEASKLAVLSNIALNLASVADSLETFIEYHCGKESK